ncbi:MAG: transposase [bacterium]
MSRALRVEFPGALYHVMSRGVARRRVFVDDVDRDAFLDGVGALTREGELVVSAFCLMPNHVHLLCRTPRGELGRWMRHINGDYARHFNSRHRRVGHLWQGRYKAILVEDGAYHLECSRYIHLNPNRSKLTRPAERYRWSSYRSYVGGRAVVDWVETATVLGMVGGRRKGYRKYVEAGRGEQPVSPFERAVAGVALGAEGFVARIRELVGAEPADGERPSLRELRRLGMARPEAIESAVEEVFKGEGERRKQVLRMYALRTYSGLRPSEVARRCGKGPSAVSMVRRRVEELASRDADLARRLRELAESLGVDSVGT